ncbi:MAG: glycosyltransferase family 4 protein [Nitrospirae bacterium]|nr:glycosyltransferase family 4 protein [Nitrospirota bacterium]
MTIAVTGTRGFPNVQGGVETHCEHLYPKLVKLGCKITVFSRKPYVSPDAQMFNGVSLMPVDCPRNKFLEAIVHTCRCVLLAHKMKPDILHIHAIGPSLFAPLARFLGMKVVVTNHGPDYMRKKWSLPAKIFLKFCERMGAVFADRIITIAGNISNDIKSKYNKESTVIPNGVQLPVLLKTDNALKQYGLEKNRYILAVGRFVPEKGFHDLIDAFSENDINNWKLVIVGKADHEDKYSFSLKAKASENKNIIFTGFLKGQPLKELYSHAGLFVLPSYYEGLPIVLLEAMSYGLSCIASDIPANRNLELSDERFFRAGDTRILAAKIKEFINKPFEEDDRKKQINMIAEKYNWGEIAKQTMEVYKLTTATATF